MSEQNIQQNNNTNTNTTKTQELDFDKWVNATGDFARLPASNNEVATYQFYPGRRELVQRDFKDPKTGEVRPTIKARYIVTIPGENGEKSLDCPKMLAQSIEANLAKNHTLLEIKRHGTGTNTRYSVVVA